MYENKECNNDKLFGKKLWFYLKYFLFCFGDGVCIY